MPWLVLLVAGMLEIGWAVGLKYTEGFTRLGPTAASGFAALGRAELRPTSQERR
jgi:quaternary ammonium compound-resistance protein SugE